MMYHLSILDSIQDLKDDFVGANGVEKIAIARDIIEERLSKTESDSENEQSLLSRVPKDAKIIETDGDVIKDAKTIGDMSKAARQYAQANFAGTSVRNIDSGENILISMKGVKHTTHNAQADLLKTIAVLPNILKDATYLSSEPDKNQPNTNVHYYGVKVSIDGRIHDVVAVVKEDGNGNRYYDHSIERENGVPESRISKTPPNTPSSKPEGLDETIAQNRDDSKQSVEKENNRFAVDLPTDETPRCCFQLALTPPSGETGAFRLRGWRNATPKNANAAVENAQNCRIAPVFVQH
jgi:hypothetical protein